MFHFRTDLGSVKRGRPVLQLAAPVAAAAAADARKVCRCSTNRIERDDLAMREQHHAWNTESNVNRLRVTTRGMYRPKPIVPLGLHSNTPR